MAEKRMFTQKIIDSDAFLDMPLSTQALYFHLNMRADDDGFINNPKRIQRTIGASEDDLKLLIAKRFLICFESGVIVIKHWRMHNTLRKDRYNPTTYQEELARLEVKDNNAYTEKECMATVWQPNGNQMATQYSIDKYSIDKVSIVEDIISDSDESEPAPKTKKTVKHKYGEYNNVLLTDEELEKLKTEYSDYAERIERLSSYVASTGKSYKSHYATIRNWARKDAEKPQTRKEPVPEWLAKKNNFTGYDNQRNYDMDNLEAELLRRNKPVMVEDDPELAREAEALKRELQAKY